MAGKLKAGTQLVRADGSVGTITAWKQTPEIKEIYNLEVNQDHTFAFGDGEWVVHNVCNSREIGKPGKIRTMLFHAH